MIRAQIQFEEDIHRQLKEEAAASECSISEYVRRCVRNAIAQKKDSVKWSASLAVAGKYRSGLGDLAAEHDRHLGDEW